LVIIAMLLAPSAPGSLMMLSRATSVSVRDDSGLITCTPGTSTDSVRPAIFI
jgi:hypothetical protein